jgi:long-chain acyl-CoA synthetase
MLSIDAGNVGIWAERNHVSFTTSTDLAQKQEVYELIAQHVARANQDLPARARVQRFVLLHRQLDADDGELTRTRTLRRAVIAKRHAPIIAALYDGASHVTIETSGSERTITLAIQSMDGRVAAEPTARRARQLARSA